MSPRRFRYGLVALALIGGGALLYLIRQASAARPAAVTIDPVGVVTFTIGSAQAPIEVWEGSDYQCPDCSRFEVEAMPDIRRRFIETGRVRWRYLLFALPNHAEAVPATHAMACALEQGQAKALVVHGGLFATQPEWSKSADHRTVFRRVAAGAGLDLGAYDACMESNRYAAAVAKSWREAQRVGIPGTPTVLLYKRFYVGGLTANQLERVLTQPPE
ncbi:MAG TPA: thioredoxin domain-containing protein [Gemmatimonadales bacterium]